MIRLHNRQSPEGIEPGDRDPCELDSFHSAHSSAFCVSPWARAPERTAATRSRGRPPGTRSAIRSSCAPCPAAFGGTHGSWRKCESAFWTVPTNTRSVASRPSTPGRTGPPVRTRPPGAAPAHVLARRDLSARYRARGRGAWRAQGAGFRACCARGRAHPRSRSRQRAHHHVRARR